MDILKRRGQVVAKLASQEISRINSSYPELNFIPFRDEYEVTYDGFVTHHGYLRAAYEIKTRKAPVENGQIIIWDGQNKYDDLLISKSKIDKCINLSSQQFLEFWLIIKFKNTTLLWQISSRHGGLLIDMKVEKKETKKTINGGLVLRENYLIPLSKAREI